ncbi:MAG: phage tail tape measure protein [Billgrantia sp.]
MSRNLRLQVILNAVDRVTRPLRQIQRGSGQTAQALRASRDQLRQLEDAQKNLRGFANLKRSSEGTARALQQQQQRVRELTQQIRQTEGPTRQLNRQREAAIRQAAQLKNRYQQEQQQLQTLRGRIRDAGGATTNLGTQQRQLSERIRTANQQMQTQQQRLGRLAERQRLAAAAAERHQRAMGGIGRMAGAGAGMMGGGIAKGYMASRLLAPGVSWAEQMSAVQAKGRFSADDERYLALRAQSRELGGSTAFSATEVGAGQEFLLQAGLSGEAVRASMRDVLDLALANNTELATTADIASNIAGNFKIDMEAEGAMARVADILSGTATRANVDLEMLGNTMKYLGGAEDLDLTMEQAVAMAGMLGNIGIQGSQAGTTMRAMLNRLTNPAKKGAAAIASIGLEVADANGNMRALPEILRDINAATADLGNVERKSILQNIFGAEAGSGMAELVNAMSDGKLDELIQTLGDNFGENARMAATRADNIGGDLKNLRSAWEEVGITITDTNDGPLRQLTQGITSVLRGTADWIKANPELAGTIATVAGALIIITTVGGALTMMLASILGPIALVRYGLTLLGIKSMGLATAFTWLSKTALPAVLGALKMLGAAILATPVGWLLAALAGIAAAAILVIKYWQPIKAFFIGLGQGLTESLSPLLTSLAPALELLKALLSPLQPIWNGIASAMGAVWGWVTRLLAPVESTSESLEAATSAGRRFGEMLAGIINFIPNVIADFTGLGVSLIDGLIGGITGALGGLRDAITGMGGSIVGWFKGVLGINSPSRVFAEFGGNLLEGLINGIDDKWGVLRDSISATANGVIGWFKDRLGINSPSRVFAELGGHTMDGYQQGLERSEQGPLREIDAFARRVRQAGAGLLLGGAAFGAAADGGEATAAGSGIAFDTRPPLQASSAHITVEGDSITLNVYPSPGMDERALAQYIGRILDERDRQKLARARSAFHDVD